jgi:hypothetical protein
MKQESRRNPIARKIRDPRFRKRVVKSKKVYTRKGRSNRPFHVFSNRLVVHLTKVVKHIFHTSSALLLLQPRSDTCAYRMSRFS